MMVSCLYIFLYLSLLFIYQYVCMCLLRYCFPWLLIWNLCTFSCCPCVLWSTHASIAVCMFSCLIQWGSLHFNLWFFLYISWRFIWKLLLWTVHKFSIMNMQLFNNSLWIVRIRFYELGSSWYWWLHVSTVEILRRLKYFAHIYLCSLLNSYVAVVKCVQA